MKRIYNFFIAALALISFASCEDVPMPYQLNTTPTVVEGVYVSESFSTSFGSFTPVTVTGTPWVIDYSTAKATGWDGSATTASEAYLISPAMNLSASENAYLTFEYILRYASSSPYKVLYSLDYVDDVAAATWVDITGSLTEGTDWNTFYTYNYQFPAEVIGQSNVHVALYYSCNNSKSITWEVKNLKVLEGVFENVPGEDTSDDYVNEPFSTSFGSFTPVTVTGTPWVIDYSTAKATGWDGSGTTASEAYLISPSIDFSASENAYLTFEYILRYASSSPYKVLYSLDYVDDVAAATWVDITGSLTEGTDWNTFYTYNYQFPAEVIGQSNVHVALYYSCNDSKSITWEVKNLIVREGVCEGGSTDTPDEPSTPAADAEGDGTEASPYNIAGVLNFINTLGADVQSNDRVYIKGKISNIIQVETSTYGNARFKISDDGTATNEFLCYNCFYLGNTKFTSANQIKVGDEVVIYGKVMNYGGNTPETVTKEAYIYSLNGNTTEGGSTDTPDEPGTGGEVITEGYDFSILMSDLNLGNAAEIGTTTFGDFTFTGESGGNSNAPKYYNAGTNVRMYPNNSLTISTNRKIEALLLHCDTYNNIVCVADGKVGATPGTVAVNGDLIGITGIGSESVTITNQNTSTGTASQIRIVSIDVKYAE